MWIKRKIKGSTLVEVIVAIVILSIVSISTFTIIIQAGNYHKNRRDIYIQNHFRQILTQIEQKTLETDYIENEMYTITIEKKPYEGNTNCIEAILKANDKKERLIKQLKVILVIDPAATLLNEKKATHELL